MTSDIASRGIDRLAIAQQVIVSAGNTLSAAGFSRDEIAAFFRQAADQLAPESASHQVVQTVIPAFDDPVTLALAAEFGEIAPVRTLAQLARDAQALDTAHRSPDALGACFDLAMKMIAQIGEAQNWLRGSADRAGVNLAASRIASPATASAIEADSHRETIYLDDFEEFYCSNFEWLGFVAGALVEREDEDAFMFLLASLVDGGVSVTTGLKDIMEAGVRALDAGKSPLA